MFEEDFSLLPFKVNRSISWGTQHQTWESSVYSLLLESPTPCTCSLPLWFRCQVREPKHQSKPSPQARKRRGQKPPVPMVSG